MTYQINLQNGKEVGRTKIQEVIAAAPVTKIIARGKAISIPDDKKRKLAAFLETFFNRREASLTELSSLRGRIQHYSLCLPYTLPFVAFLLAHWH